MSLRFEFRGAAEGGRRSSTLRCVLLVGAVWIVLAFCGLFWNNPFRVATDAALEAAGESLESAQFIRGRYGFRLFWSVASADVHLESAEGQRRVHVEMLHLPLVGWQLREFRVAPGTAEDGSLRSG